MLHCDRLIKIETKSEFIHFLKLVINVDVLVLAESVPIRGVGRVTAVLPLPTSMCMLPVLSRLKRSARGFIRCLESDASSLLNSSSCVSLGVAGGGLHDVTATAALMAATAESSASNEECLPQKYQLRIHFTM